jgi:hypothetical protein
MAWGSLSPHYSWQFVAKSLSRVVRAARGALRTRGVLWQYVEGPRGEPADRQVRRHLACEVERPLYDPGAKKENRNEF